MQGDPPIPDDRDSENDDTVGLGGLLWVADRGRPAPKPPPRDFPGAELLVAPDAHTVLARITPGDPLALERRCVEYLRAQALLVDRERLVGSALARVAHQSMSYHGQPALEAWLARCVEAAALSVLEYDIEATRRAEPLEDDDECARLLSAVIGVAPQHARQACSVFNDLPPPVRRDFWALAVERKSIAEHSAAGFGTPATIERNVKRAVLALATLRDTGPGPRRNGGDA